MISVGFKTDRGMRREGNEDALFVLPEQQLYIVADGVGGHNSGELASRMAVGYIAQYVALHPLSNISGKTHLRKYFEKCFLGANELIFKKAQREGENEGMATTAVLSVTSPAGGILISGVVREPSGRVRAGAAGYGRAALAAARQARFGGLAGASPA